MEQANGDAPMPRRRKKQMLELLSKYDKGPAMTTIAFCKLYQISEGSFYSARKRYRSSVTSHKKQSGFIAIARPAFKESAGSLFTEVNGIKLYQAVSADYLIYGYFCSTNT